MHWFTSIFQYVAALPPECSKGFFGLPHWYEYLPMEYDPVSQTCNVSKDFQLLGSGSDSGLLLIGLALVDMALRVAGLVAVGFVLWGGFKFLTSQGEPDAIARARNTIINALIGLVLTIVATALVVFVGRTLSS